MLFEEIRLIFGNALFRLQPVADHQLCIRRRPLVASSAFPGNRCVGVLYEAFHTFGEAGHKPGPSKLAVDVHLLSGRLLSPQRRKDRFVFKLGKRSIAQPAGLSCLPRL